MIVGKEDENNAPSSFNDINNTQLALKMSLCAELIEKYNGHKVLLLDAILLVDPSDGIK
jgi:hypothetical protein